jgi:hypothetical protein
MPEGSVMLVTGKWGSHKTNIITKLVLDAVVDKGAKALYVACEGAYLYGRQRMRPGKRPSGLEIRAFVRRLVGVIRTLWPKVEILLRADSHYASPQVFDWCRANRVDWIFGLAPNAALSRHVAALERSTAERFKAAPTHGKRRRFTQFYDAAQSWSRVERIIARVEAGPQGTDTRFIVTNLSGGRAKH